EGGGGEDGGRDDHGSEGEKGQNLVADHELAGGDVGEEGGQRRAYAGGEHAQLEGVDDGALGRAVEEGEGPVGEGEVLPAERFCPPARDGAPGAHPLRTEHPPAP